ASSVLSGLSGTSVKFGPVCSGANRNFVAPQLLHPGRPCTSSMQISRVRSVAAALAATRPAGTIASRKGSATVAPMPRRNVRRGKCFPVMKDIVCVSTLEGCVKFVPAASVIDRCSCCRPSSPPAPRSGARCHGYIEAQRFGLLLRYRRRFSAFCPLHAEGIAPDDAEDERR